MLSARNFRCDLLQRATLASNAGNFSDIQSLLPYKEAVPFFKSQSSA